jgi:uncharacterized protein (DUF305 family)
VTIAPVARCYLMTRTVAVTSALLLGLLGGCSVSSSAPAGEGTPSGVRPTAVSADHNDADLAYVDQMLSQHQQVVDMVAMVANKDVPVELRRLARTLGDDRAAEMRVLRRMGRAWGVPAHRPDYHANPGEMTMDQLVALYDLDGPAFVERWTQRLVDNQLGAVAMSRAELADGLNLGAREFARGLVRLQERQIAQLRGLAGAAPRP